MPALGRRRNWTGAIVTVIVFGILAYAIISDLYLIFD